MLLWYRIRWSNETVTRLSGETFLCFPTPLVFHVDVTTASPRRHLSRVVSGVPYCGVDSSMQGRVKAVDAFRPTPSASTAGSEQPAAIQIQIAAVLPRPRQRTPARELGS